MIGFSSMKPFRPPTGFQSCASSQSPDGLTRPTSNGLNTGLHVDWTRVTRDEMYSASAAGFRKGDSQTLGGLIAKITTGIEK
jgi:hypothetical protein